MTGLVYVKYQLKHNTLLITDKDQAEGILSSDGATAYHLSSLKPFPVDDFYTVSIEEITETQYQRLKTLYGMTLEEIIDSYTLDLIERGIL